MTKVSKLSRTFGGQQLKGGQKQKHTPCGQWLCWFEVTNNKFKLDLMKFK